MLSFVRKISLYVLPIVILAIGLEVYVENIPNSYTHKRNYMDQHASDVHTLILGSSYAHDGIDPNMLSHAFNLANSSQCFEDDYRLLERYVDQMDSLEHVLLPLSYGSLPMVSSSNRRGYYTIYMDIYPRWPISKYSFECFNLEQMAKKFITFIIQHDLVQCDSLGLRAGLVLDQRPVDWKKVEQLVDNDRFIGNNSIQYVEENIQWLNKMAQLCQEHGVELWLIAMPMLSEYIDQMPVEQIQLMVTTMQSLAEQYPHVHYLDYQRWGSEDDFWNATHLNWEGARRFTEEIRMILRNNAL